MIKIMMVMLTALTGALSLAAQEGKPTNPLSNTLAEINDRFSNMKVELLVWPDELHRKLGNLKKVAFLARSANGAPGKKPLLISLHGGGGRMMSLERQLARSAQVKGLRLVELAGKDLILLEPNSAVIWDVESLNSMLDYTIKKYQDIDQNRIYVMGHSMGGWGTWAWINESLNGLQPLHRAASRRQKQVICSVLRYCQFGAWRVERTGREQRALRKWWND